MKSITRDVLIVGGGGAACRAAIAAAEKGASVVMVLEKTLGKSGSTTIEASEIAAFNVPGATDEKDSPEAFYNDIITAGQGMAVPELAQILVEQADARYQDLSSWGLHCEKRDGRFLGLHGCFSSYSRGYAIKGHGGTIVELLKQQLLKHSNITILENSMVIDFLVNGGEYAGAYGLDSDDEPVFFDTKAAIIAAGGAAQVFKNNLNPPDVAGDGYALAWRAGAEMMNLEFMQGGVGFHHPIKSLFQAHFWAGFPVITDKNGRQFVHDYLPVGIDYKQACLEHAQHFPFSCIDSSKYIDIAVQNEIFKGNGTQNGGVFVSFEHFTDDYISSLEVDVNLKKLWGLAKEHFSEMGIDLMHDPIEISCIAQAINGGVRIDRSAATSVPGIFAAGESAAGPHGADRLGGNMLLASQVFGKIAGESAAAYAKKNSQSRCDIKLVSRSPIYELLYKSGDSKLLNAQVQDTAQSNLLVSRSAEQLQKMFDAAYGFAAQIEESPSSDKPKRENIKLLNKIQAAEMMAMAALERCESRGSHYRMDFPDKNDAFNSPFIFSIAKNNKGVKL